MKNTLITLVACALVGFTSHAETRVSAGSGDWSNVQNWAGGFTPDTDDGVVIRSSDTIWLSHRNEVLKDLDVQGVLVLVNGVDIIVRNGNVDLVNAQVLGNCPSAPCGSIKLRNVGTLQMNNSEIVDIAVEIEPGLIDVVASAASIDYLEIRGVANLSASSDLSIREELVGSGEFNLGDGTYVQYLGNTDIGGRSRLDIEINQNALFENVGYGTFRGHISGSGTIAWTGPFALLSKVNVENWIIGNGDSVTEAYFHKRASSWRRRYVVAGDLVVNDHTTLHFRDGTSRQVVIQVLGSTDIYGSVVSPIARWPKRNKEFRDIDVRAGGSIINFGKDPWDIQGDLFLWEESIMDAGPGTYQIHRFFNVMTKGFDPQGGWWEFHGNYGGLWSPPGVPIGGIQRPINIRNEPGRFTLHMGSNTFVDSLVGGGTFEMYDSSNLAFVGESPVSGTYSGIFRAHADGNTVSYRGAGTGGTILGTHYHALSINKLQGNLKTGPSLRIDRALELRRGLIILGNTDSVIFSPYATSIRTNSLSGISTSGASKVVKEFGQSETKFKFPLSTSLATGFEMATVGVSRTNLLAVSMSAAVAGTIHPDFAYQTSTARSWLDKSFAITTNDALPYSIDARLVRGDVMGDARLLATIGHQDSAWHVVSPTIDYMRNALFARGIVGSTVLTASTLPLLPQAPKVSEGEVGTVSRLTKQCQISKYGNSVAIKQEKSSLMRIVNVLGVESELFYLNKGNNTFDLSDRTPGLYILQREGCSKSVITH